jgi:hypothetical protein
MRVAALRSLARTSSASGVMQFVDDGRRIPHRVDGNLLLLLPQ